MTSRLLTLTYLALSIFAVPEAHGADFRVGERFPALALPSLTDGKPVSILDFQGQKLVLHVWASW